MIDTYNYFLFSFRLTKLPLLNMYLNMTSSTSTYWRISTAVLVKLHFMVYIGKICTYIQTEHGSSKIHTDSW